jgi:hypothetical protein
MSYLKFEAAFVEIITTFALVKDVMLSGTLKLKTAVPLVVTPQFPKIALASNGVTHSSFARAGIAKICNSAIPAINTKAPNLPRCFI